jgi:hypothetical protein
VTEAERQGKKRRDKAYLADTNECSREIGLFPGGWVLGDISFVQFDKGVQRGKNTFNIHNVGTALDAVASMVFAKILSKKFIDMAGQKNVDRWIQKVLGGQSVGFAPMFPVDLSQAIIACFLIDAIFLKTAFGHDDRDDFKRIHPMSPGSIEDQTGVPQHFGFGKLIFGKQPDHTCKMHNFFRIDVGGFCVGEKLLHSGWKAGARGPLGKRRNVSYQDKNGDGHDEDDFDALQDGMEHYPFFQFRLKVACRMIRYHLDVEKPHFSSSSFTIFIFFS